MVTEKLKLLNDQSYFVVSDVSVVCPRCGARLAANRSPASLVPAGPGGFRCSPPRTRNAGAVGPHDPQVPVFRILLTRQLRTACAYRRTVAAGKVAGSFPRSGVRTTFACSSFLFSDRAAQSRTVRIAPHRVVPGLTVRPVLHCAVPGCAERSVRAAPYRSVRVAPQCCRVVLCRTVQTLRTRAGHPASPTDRAASCHAVRIAPHRVVPGLTVRPVLHCAVPGCSEAECSRRAVSQRPGRSVVLPCCALSYRSNAPYSCRIIPSCPVRAAPECRVWRIAATGNPLRSPSLLRRGLRGGPFR